MSRSPQASRGDRVPLGVAPLSALDLPVIEYVRAAADAGFTSVGLRAHPVADSDPHFPLDTSSGAFRELVSTVTATGVTVLDLEVFSITSSTRREDWLTVLGAGERLGARYLNVIGAHPSAAEFEQVVGTLTADAGDHGLVPVLEPVAYRALNSFDHAVDIARAVGCAVELDVLHFLRTGATVELVSDNRDLFPIFQLCDAPADIGDHGDSLAAIGARTDEENLEIVESRSLRRLPGEGDGPVRELLRLLGASTHVSVEVPNVLIRGDRPAAEYLRLLHDQAQDFMAVVTGES